MTRFINIIFADMTREDIKDLFFVLIVGSISSAIVWGINIYAGLTLNAFGFVALTANPIGLILTSALFLVKEKRWNALRLLTTISFGTLTIIFHSEIATFLILIVGAMSEYVVSNREDK